ncbi:MAG: hypothetical protein KKD17_06740 [Nanoarchaeota archaeon]|nr:hypothetical protein [Nanoarchaeota archaeon]
MENANPRGIGTFDTRWIEEKEEPWMVWVDNLFLITILLLLLATIAWFIKIRMGG